MSDVIGVVAVGIITLHTFFTIAEVDGGGRRSTRLILKPLQSDNSVYGLFGSMTVPLRRSLEFLDIEQIPIRIDIIVICSLTKRRADSDDEHAVVHTAVIVSKALPRKVLVIMANDREELCSMIIQLIERMITVGHLAHTCIRNVNEVLSEILFVYVFAALRALPDTASVSGEGKYLVAMRIAYVFQLTFVTAE